MFSATTLTMTRMFSSHLWLFCIVREMVIANSTSLHFFWDQSTVLTFNLLIQLFPWPCCYVWCYVLSVMRHLYSCSWKFWHKLIPQIFLPILQIKKIFLFNLTRWHHGPYIWRNKIIFLGSLQKLDYKSAE